MVGKMVLVGVAAAAGLMLAGCNNEKTQKTSAATSQPARVQNAAVVPVNSMCPLGKHTFNTATRDADTSRTYKGSTIGFCCEDCAHKFDAMNGAEKDQVLAAAKANKPM
jgi:YHS domain-containing protein